MATAYGSQASAQQHTFKLDRLEVWGAPDDGIGVMRPYTTDKTVFFAQLGLGYSLDPLRTTDVTTASQLAPGASSIVINGQWTEYLTAGLEFLDHFTVALSLPVTEMYGNQPEYASFTTGGTTDLVNTGGVAAGDMRLDLRAVALRTKDRKGALGAGVSMFFPTGDATLWTGDGQTSALFMITGEYSFHLFRDFNLIAVINTGIDLRPTNYINQPWLSPPEGIGVGNEWRWAAGAYLPLAQDKYRLGVNFYGQTGLDNNTQPNQVGNTTFSALNTPLELQGEARMRFGSFDRWWAGVGAGARLDGAYGAPDLRIVLLAGFYTPILDTNANSPEAKLERRKRYHDLHLIDTDHDGIPDDIDACPTEPEDHLGNDPSDGCPMPPDRDGDGVPDQYDKCPDVPAPTADGCPLDTDKDGIPDATDACPREPGPPNPDPKKNGCPQFIKLEGSVVRILQQVHFATASTTILPDSFPMLQEIANLLHANPSIKRMSIDGHTDNRGAADYNMNLSQGRATSVMTWLTQHGIEQNRLEAHGYGLTKPIADNNTDAGRLANRRVEFHILEEGDIKPAKP